MTNWLPWSGDKNTDRSVGAKCGLDNHGNTCYCNSVLQALFHCEQFRQACLSQKLTGDSLVTGLRDLFTQMELQGKSGESSSYKSLSTKQFLTRLREKNEMFRGTEQHDAHEFFNYLINEIAETLEPKGGNTADLQHKSSRNEERNPKSDDSKTYTPVTWVHELFEGTVIYKTRCRCCENISKMVEPFVELSVDIKKDSTLALCLQKQFGGTEELKAQEKYFCDHCNCLQEAERSLTLGRLPLILVVHLKRFKYDEQCNRFWRLDYYVMYPRRLYLKSGDREAMQYSLSAIVVHVGTNATHGHYICCVPRDSQTILFDDHVVKSSDEDLIQVYYGASAGRADGKQCGYLLFYTQDRSESSSAANDDSNSFNPANEQFADVSGTTS